jgi:hypothetical protein
VLELVHNAADGVLLRLGLMGRHWLTSRNWIIVKIVCWLPSVPTICDKRPNYRAPYTLCSRPFPWEPIVRLSRWRQQVQLDRDRTIDVKNPAGAFCNCCPIAPSLETVLESRTMGRGLLLWLLGIPIPVIILLYVFHVI